MIGFPLFLKTKYYSIVYKYLINETLFKQKNSDSLPMELTSFRISSAIYSCSHSIMHYDMPGISVDTGALQGNQDEWEPYLRMTVSGLSFFLIFILVDLTNISVNC